MPSYVVTGASRGLGFEFLRQLSNDPNNTVIGLVRNKTATEKSVAQELSGRKNIHIVQADITDYEALKTAAGETSSITGGSLDYLIANAGLISQWSAYDGLYALGKEPKELDKDLIDCFNVNVIGNIHLFNLFLPLIQKGNAKKVIALGTGMADDALTVEYDLDIAGPYSISKAAMNTVVAKYSAEFRKEGILFLSLSPGFVQTGQYENATEEQLRSVQAMGAKFAQYAPDFKGPITPEESIKAMMSVIEGASIEKGDGGAFLSHHGNKHWL
ncbi:hypothetical protein OHC33_000608 [Knufia fluminis]|uniref:NAD(P)-binding protein n=1 Tax=Knufia fluminis TaxID=191047 RepID=A0AAN8EQN2_9EURO|nr:hypothetical protein OHC33_000608 [Knufia fluminis]